MSTRGLRRVIREEMGMSLRQAMVKSVHGNTVSVQVGGSPKYLRGLPVVGGVDNVVAGDTVVLYEADGRIYAEATKAKAGHRYGNKSGASVAAVMGPHAHLASSSGGVLASYVRVDDPDAITAQHSFSPPSAQSPFLLGGHAQSQLVVGLRADQLNKSVLAGSGLAGGGVLTADRTLTVDLTHVFNWSGLHTFGDGIDISGTLEFQAGGTISTLEGTLTIQATGDIIFHPTSNDLLPFTAYDINIGSLAKKYLTLHCAELWVETLVAQETIATIGGRILVGPTTVLTVDLGSDPGHTTITVKHNEMASGDRVYMEANGKVEFMSIDSAPGGAGPYTYTVTRDLDGSGRNVWYAGDAIFNTGTTGEGFIDLYSVHGVKAPTEYGPAIVGNVRLSTTYNDWAEHWAVGNLNGIYGYTATTYGLAAGKFADGCAWVSVDATNGFRVMYGAASPYALAQWDMSGNVLVGRTGTGQSNVYVSAGKLELRNNTTAAITLTATGALIINKYGDMFFSAADGLLLLGSGCEITDAKWQSLRGQAAVITGALHQEAGRWQGTRALVVEMAATNYEPNPRMYDGNSDGKADGWGQTDNVTGTPTYAIIAHPRTERGWMQRVQWTGAAESDKYILIYDDTPVGSFASPDPCTLSFDYKGQVVGTTFQARISARDAGGVHLGYSSTISFYPSTAMQRGVVTYAELPATTSYVRIQILWQLIDEGDYIDTYVGAVNVEKTIIDTSFVAGSLGHEYAWSGTAENSTSTRAVTKATLDSLVALVSEKDTLSFRAVVQAPYDADATWINSTYNMVFDIRGGSTQRIYLSFMADTNTFRLHVNGTHTASAAQTFKAGDWLDLVVTLDYTNDEYLLYLNGEEIISHTTALTSGVLTDWRLGSSWTGSYQSFTFAEYAVFDRVLTPAEAAAMYALQRPLVDIGAMDLPGIYILDGRFRIASSLTGNRIEIDANEIAGYDSAGTKQFYLQSSDGKAYTAGGKFVMEEAGVWLEGTSSQAQSRQFRYYYDDSGTLRRLGFSSGVYGTAEGESFMWFMSTRESGDPWGSGARTIIDAYDFVPNPDLEAFVDLRSQYEIVGVGDNLALCANATPSSAMKGSGEGVFALQNAGTVPTSNYTGGHILYSQAGALKGRGSGGTVTTIAPAEPHCPVCGRDFVLEWKNEEQETHLRVCVWCLVRNLAEAGVDVGKFVLKDTGQDRVQEVVVQPAIVDPRPRHLM